MEVIKQGINGISLGSMYALIALGYTMVYGIVRLINFAHGDVLMLGAFTGFFTVAFVSSNPAFFSNPFILILAIIVSMVVCALVGIVIERSCYRRLRNSPKINALITAIGISIVLENAARMVPFIGPNPKQVPVFQPNISIPILSKYGISVVQIICLLVSITLMLLLNYIVKKTKVGKAMRAVSQDMVATNLMGISANKIIAFTFAIGAALAGAAGVLYAITYPSIQPYMGIMPGLKAFVAAILGGIGSIPGAVLGGFIIGMLETLTRALGWSQWTDAVVFGIFILILIVKPSGLLGKNIREKV